MVSVLALLLISAPAWAQSFEERYRSRVAQFERENAKLSSASRSVVLFGSSSMEGWKNGRRVERFLPRLAPRVRNRGISGDGIGIKTSTGLYPRIQASVTGASPTHVFVLNGRNSLGYGVDRVAARYRDVIRELRRTSPDAVLTVVACAPVRKKYTRLKEQIVDLNGRLETMAREEGAFFFDLHARLVDSSGLMKRSLTSDGLHFKDEGYRILGAEIERIVASGQRPTLPTPATPATPLPTPATPAAPQPTPVAPAPRPAPAAPTETREVVTSGLNLRRGPGTGHPVVAILPRGTELSVRETQGAWIKVKAGEREGWLYKAFTAPVPAALPTSPETHQVSATRLNLRGGPGLGEARIGSLARGTKLRVLARQGIWWQVEAGPRQGWVHSAYVEGISSAGISGTLR